MSSRVVSQKYITYIPLLSKIPPSFNVALLPPPVKDCFLFTKVFWETLGMEGDPTEQPKLYLFLTAEKLPSLNVVFSMAKAFNGLNCPKQNFNSPHFSAIRKTLFPLMLLFLFFQLPFLFQTLFQTLKFDLIPLQRWFYGLWANQI